MIESSQLREWDADHVWHPFTPMSAFVEEAAPIIAAAEGFELIDLEGRRYLDGISSLWCNIHGHRVPELDQAIRDQLDRVAHTTLLGLSAVPSIELAHRLAELAPPGLSHIFYSDSGSTAVEAALKIAFQFHQQSSPQRAQRDLFVTVGGAYHGDTLGAVSVGQIELFHRTYGQLLFKTVSVPSPVTLRRPVGQSRQDYLDYCFWEVERVVSEFAPRLAAMVIEPLVQGAAGILVHPPGYLRHVREVTRKHGVLLIADEVAVGFGRTGTMFACEQEQVVPDLLCLAKGLSGGYLPLAATLATDEIFAGFLGAPSEQKTFFHGHTFTGNSLACAAALANLNLFDSNAVLKNVQCNSDVLARRLSVLEGHAHVAEVRQKGIMIGIELVRDRNSNVPFPMEQRTGHLVTLAARQRGVMIRPLGDVVVLMPAPAMAEKQIHQLCDVVLESIEEVTCAGS
jgi:adenosylmethionine-8-amino-7-oxononanoate aminotransferase